MKQLKTVYPDLSEGEISIFHGDNATEGSVIESLTTRGLFATRTILIYQEPDFLQPSGKKQELGAKLLDALNRNDAKRVVGILARLMKEKRVSVAELLQGSKEAIKRLALPAETDLNSLLELAEKFQARLQEIMDQADQPGGERILEWISRGIEQGRGRDVFLVIQLERGDKRQKLFKRFCRLCPVTDLTGAGESYGKKTAAMQARVRQWLSEAGKEIDANALKYFMTKVGEDSLSALKNETEKLISLSGQRKQIGIKDVQSLVVRHREEEIFRITEAFRKRDVPGVLTSFRHLQDQGIHPLAVLSAIRNFLLRMVALKVAVDSAGLGAQVRNVQYNTFKNRYWDEIKSVFDRYGKNPVSSLHPYAAYMNVSAINMFSWQELFDMLGEMADLDLALKGSRVGPETVLESFFMRHL